MISGWRRASGSIWRFLWAGIDWFMAGLLLTMIALVFANVIMRYGFSSGLRPSVELSRLGLDRHARRCGGLAAWRTSGCF